jgi:hypothetical protein
MVRAYDLCRLDKIDNEIRSFVYSKRPWQKKAGINPRLFAFH